MKTRIIDLALAELNAKWWAVRVYCQCNDLNEDVEGIAMMQNDLERLTKLTGKSPLLDSNYSNTWGYEAYGLYQSLEEMQEVAEIIEGGF